jgi:hypothetical protein
MDKVVKIATVLFYAGLALFFFGIGFPYLEIIIGICALVLLIGTL